MLRLSLVSDTPDVELDAIRRTLAHFDGASGMESIVDVLRQKAVSGKRIEVVDAIGHSRSPGFIMMGSWAIDDSPQTAATFSGLIRPWLEQLGVRVLRFVGCGTALTDRGRTALSHVAYAARCQVFGTIRHIGKHDYGPDGFTRDDALAEVVRRRRRDSGGFNRWRSESRDRNL